MNAGKKRLCLIGVGIAALCLFLKRGGSVGA
jgi:hypothetical protein